MSFPSSSTPLFVALSAAALVGCGPAPSAPTVRSSFPAIETTLKDGLPVVSAKDLASCEADPSCSLSFLGDRIVVLQNPGFCQTNAGCPDDLVCSSWEGNRYLGDNAWQGEGLCEPCGYPAPPRSKVSVSSSSADAIDNIQSICIRVETSRAAAVLAYEAQNDAAAFLQEADFRVGAKQCDARLSIELDAELTTVYYNAADSQVESGYYTTGSKGDGVLTLTIDAIGSEPVYSAQIGLTNPPPQRITDSLVRALSGPCEPSVPAYVQQEGCATSKEVLAYVAFDTWALGNMIYDLWGPRRVMLMAKKYNVQRNTFWKRFDYLMEDFITSQCGQEKSKISTWPSFGRGRNDS